MYGYYGRPELSGGFVYWDSFSSERLYHPLNNPDAEGNFSDTFHTLSDNGIQLGEVIFDLIDGDGDKHHDGNDLCPDADGYIDNDSDGVCQPTDACDSDADKYKKGICGCGVSDKDTDGDGTADCKDHCKDDSGKIEPGICGCGTPDVDTDKDGTYDCDDRCKNDPAKIIPGMCGCGNLEATTDNNHNGVIDAGDCIPNACPDDPDKYVAGVCGCGIPDTDVDGDGTLDCNDGCPMIARRVHPAYVAVLSLMWTVMVMASRIALANNPRRWYSFTITIRWVLLLR